MGMAYTDKYLKKNRLDGDPLEASILGTFESVIDGSARYDVVFLMTDDAHVRDYALWLNKKREHGFA